MKNTTQDHKVVSHEKKIRGFSPIGRTQGQTITANTGSAKFFNSPVELRDSQAPVQNNQTPDASF